MSEKLSPEEREILDQFERGELHPVADVEHELEMARQAARNTLDKAVPGADAAVDRGAAAPTDPQGPRP